MYLLKLEHSFMLTYTIIRKRTKYPVSILKKKGGMLFGAPTLKPVYMKFERLRIKNPTAICTLDYNTRNFIRRRFLQLIVIKIIILY